ncbi:MAG: gamma carbonic anhydrase family protein [Candidatus Wallbacteria bacterium]
MPVRKYCDYIPEINDSAYIDDSAVIIGRVKIDADASIWPGAVLRGDINEIIIGAGSNVQDGAVLHVTYEQPVVIGKGVTVGHLAAVHAVTVGDNSLIGIGAILLDGAVIGNNCIIAAGSLVTPRTVIPDNSMVMGAPAKVVRQLKPEEIEGITKNGEAYLKLVSEYKK